MVEAWGISFIEGEREQILLERGEPGLYSLSLSQPCPKALIDSLIKESFSLMSSKLLSRSVALFTNDKYYSNLSPNIDDSSHYAIVSPIGSETDISYLYFKAQKGLKYTPPIHLKHSIETFIYIVILSSVLIVLRDTTKAR